MAEFPAPSAAGLEALLVDAFEFMPGPDMARLAEIEARLLRAVRRPAPARRAAPPWWAILLLAGGAATAAWWAGEHFIERNGAAVDSGESAATVKEYVGRPRAADETGHGTGVTRRPDAAPVGDDRRIIYEREAP